MGYAILRIAPRKSLASAGKMLRHALREDKVPNAIESAPKPPVGAGYASSGEAMQALKAKIAAAREVRAGWQKHSTAALDILVTATRQDMLAMSLAEQNAFFTKALRFIQSRFGGSENVLTAVIHRDESTPHMQVLIAPVDANGRFSASKMVGNRTQLSQLQDEFWESCGKPHNLERGNKRSGAHHIPIRAFYAALDEGRIEIPRYVEVPPAPGLVDRLRPGYQEKKKAHERALAHNAEVRKAVHAQAKVGRAVHPEQMARAANRYRRALDMERVVKGLKAEAQREQAVARKVVGDARGEHAKIEAAKVRAKADLGALEATRSAVERTVEAGWHIGTIDSFSATVTPEYRAALAKDLGIPLRPGKLLDQVRRGLGLRSGLEAAQAIERATLARGGGSFASAAGEWAARRELEPGDEQRPGG